VALVATACIASPRGSGSYGASQETVIAGASMRSGVSDRPQWGHATGGVEKAQAEGSRCGGKTCFNGATPWAA